MNPYAIAGIAVAAILGGLWLIVRAYGRERAQAASRKVELAQAIVDRAKEERKSGLDSPMPGEVDDFWASDEPSGAAEPGVPKPGVPRP